MALTRKMLSAMEISEEKISEIMKAHLSTVEEIKEERDKAQADLESLKKENKNAEELQEKLDSATEALEKLEKGNWEKKYNDIKSEYDNFKSDTEAKATKSKKEAAYKQLLVDAGVSAKRLDSILKVSESNIDKIEFDEEGNVKDAEKITKNVKEEWADFISTSHEKGAEVSNPPANNGGEIKKPSLASELVAQYRSEHYGSPKED